MVTTRAPAPKRFTAEEYYRLGSLGFLNEPVELIDGMIIEMAPIGPEHAAVTTLLRGALEAQLPAGFHVRDGLPLGFGDSQPQPDLAIVSGRAEDYRQAHPRTASLVIEVAQTSFAFDRDTKASLYARHQIPEYWIVDLVSKSVIVHRCPMDDRYTEEATFSRAHTITPLAVPVLEVNLADIL